MAFQVELSPKSHEDLAGIYEYVSIQSVRAAEEICQSIIERAESLEEFADRGRIVPEFLDEGIKKYRQILEGHYRIIYRYIGSIVYIVRIVDSRQLLNMDFE